MKSDLLSTIRAWLGSGSRPSVPAKAPPAIPPALASLPENRRFYAIGDIHGCADLLAELYRQIDRIEAERNGSPAVEVILGDFVDRGPDSRQVIDMLLERSQHRVVVTLRGNHEHLMLDALVNPERLRLWLRLGGLETLRSYGVSPASPLDSDNLIETIRRANQAIPAKHLEFLEGLPAILHIGNVAFVHAGIRPGIATNEQAFRDLIEIREPFLAHQEMFDSYVIHGHTPTARVDWRHNRLNLDTGAYATGRLSGALIERDRIEIIEARAPGVQP